MDIATFWANVDKSGECWLWRLSTTRAGYGQAHVGGRNWRAHRLAYVLMHGEIPEGLVVCHRCDVPRCVNPEHLFLGTQKENLADMVRKCRGRHPFGEAQPTSRLNNETVQHVRQLYESGVSSYEIGARLGIHPTTAWGAATGRNWAHLGDAASRRGRRTGTAHHNAKLNPEEVREIRRRAAQGEKRSQLGADPF